VPAKLFKVVMARSGGTLIAIGFLMPQVYTESDIKRYVASVDKVDETF
jgi:hypothetical protein